MRTKHRVVAVTLAGLVAAAAGCAQDREDELRVGVLTTLEGPMTAIGHESLRGVRLALAEVDEQVAGKRVRLFTGPTNSTPNSVMNAARRLIEQDRVQIVVGPASGSEVLALVQFAKEYPGITFLNGTAAAPEATYREPAENFFRFNAEGVMWQAGLGRYVHDELGYRRVASLVADYSYGWAQMKGFSLEFCRAGGRIVERLWTPIGTTDFSSVIARIPRNVDALYVLLVGADATNFLTQYVEAGAPVPLIAGTNTVDQTVLATLTRPRLRELMIGVPSAGPVADDWPNEAYQRFVADYRRLNPDGLPAPAGASLGYYLNTKAMIRALEEVGGDLSENHAAFRRALSSTTVESPIGPVRLDENRQGNATIFVTRVAADGDGNLFNTFVRATENVTQTMGLDPAEFAALGVPGRETIQCP
jgi:branched-chain amino acid transport system substrate-binding protein